jgi:ribosomal protein S18 acetylase RimI-like enzyme
MLYYAAHMAEDGLVSSQDARIDPFLAKYVDGWGREGDLGVIAEGADGEPIGAAWLRALDEVERGYPDVPAEFPELAIAVDPSASGRGVGASLLAALLNKAQTIHPGVVLSVRAGNRAIRLYERFGFDVVEEIENRVGGRSLVMILTFD